MENHYNFKDRKGESFESGSLGEIEIIEYRGTLDCDVLVKNTGDVLKSVSYGNLKAGTVKNPFLPVLFRVGFMGEGFYKSRNDFNEKTKTYNTWKSMLERCYSKNTSYKNISYIKTKVCKEWHNFQNFAKWFEENYIEGFQLDKDILVKGNKIYSPETCCFVPQEINIFFVEKKSNIGVYPVGIHLNKKSGTYITRITNFGKRVTLGSFKVVEEAEKVYFQAKKEYGKKLAEKWKEHITEDVYIILNNCKHCPYSL